MLVAQLEPLPQLLHEGLLDVRLPLHRHELLLARVQPLELPAEGGGRRQKRVPQWPSPELPLGPTGGSDLPLGDFSHFSEDRGGQKRAAEFPNIYPPPNRWLPLSDENPEKRGGRGTLLMRPSGRRVRPRTPSPPPAAAAWRAAPGACRSASAAPAACCRGCPWPHLGVQTGGEAVSPRSLLHRDAGCDVPPINTK